MAFEDHLNDLCDIYHAQKGDESPGYGLTEQPSFSYPKEPGRALCGLPFRG